MKIVLLLSGGLDSVVLLNFLLQTHKVVATVSMDYGSKHNAKELIFAKWHSEYHSIVHKIVTVPFIANEFRSNLLISGADIPAGKYDEESLKQTVIPFRNAIMISLATGFAESCGAEAVAIAAHDADTAIYVDCRPSFLAAMNQTMQLGTDHQIELLSPFSALSKTNIVSIGHTLQVDFEKTWSCYCGLDIHCGKCGTCYQRKEAFLLANIKDPTAYLEL